MLYLTIFIVTASISAAISLNSSPEDNGIRIRADNGMAYLGGEGSFRTSEDYKGKRSRRSSITIIDGQTRSDVMSVFNTQRSLVGASDMNYVYWNYQSEEFATNWTSGCNYDAPLPLPSGTFYSIKGFNSTNYTPAQLLKILMNSTDFYYATRSIYVTGVSGVKSICSPATAGGQNYASLNIYAFVFPVTSQFNGTVQQYALGTPCSQCQTGVNWCYNNLCTDNCNLDTFGCCQISSNGTVGVCATTPVPSTTLGSGGNSAFALDFEFARRAMLLLGLLLSAVFTRFN